MAATCAFYLANESLSAQESILWKSHLGAEADMPKKGMGIRSNVVSLSWRCSGGSEESHLNIKKGGV